MRINTFQKSRHRRGEAGFTGLEIALIVGVSVLVGAAIGAIVTYLLQPPIPEKVESKENIFWATSKDKIAPPGEVEVRFEITKTIGSTSMLKRYEIKPIVIGKLVKAATLPPEVMTFGEDTATWFSPTEMNLDLGGSFVELPTRTECNPGDWEFTVTFHTLNQVNANPPGPDKLTDLLNSLHTVVPFKTPSETVTTNRLSILQINIEEKDGSIGLTHEWSD